MQSIALTYNQEYLKINQEISIILFTQVLITFLL